MWRASWEVQYSARAVRPILDSIPSDPDEAKEEYLKRAKQYWDATETYLDAVTKQRPFIPPAVYEACELVEKSVIKLKNEFEKTYRGAEDRIKWETISEEETKLNELMADLNKRIRQHIHEVPNQHMDVAFKTLFD